MTTTERHQDPKAQYPEPPFPKQQQEPPGTEDELEPKADHGEETYRGSGRLTDRVALITGGDSGIGKAVAIAMAREGADVAISYLGGMEEPDAADTAAWVEKAGRRAIQLPGDVRDEEHCRSLVERTVSELGNVDIVVNNAAWQKCGDRIEEMTTEEWRRIFATNIEAMFHISKAAIPRMREGGTIINTASIQAYSPSPELLPSSATKGAIVTFTKGLAQDPGVLERGLRVNAVAPGPIWTPLIPSTMPAEKAAKFGENTPLGRAGQPAELAPIYVFLASQESSYITGEVVGVTGGRPLG
ncbi:MAG TPA: SDR family oxidoreductase [Candidatus Limnocylindria bacterium]|nr:SDR family oxidoreductase [Candidatus Limnocylindria bacterium]